MNNSTRVVVVDDDAAIVEALTIGLPAHGNFQVTAHYSSGQAALAGLPTLRADVVLMDIRMPGIGGIDCARRFKTLKPSLPLLMFTACGDGRSILDAVLAGADGYLVKPVMMAECAAAIRKALNGEESMSVEVVQRLIQSLKGGSLRMRGVDLLTLREQQMLNGLLRGLSDKDLAMEMKIAPSTVHTHMRQLFKKLGVHSRSEAIQSFLAARGGNTGTGTSPSA